MHPPPKPKGTPDDLAEVERALSVLQGRHPEHERARREGEEARARRAAEIERNAIDATKSVRRRRLRVFLMALPVAALFGVVTYVVRRETHRQARVEQAADTYRAHGFALVETSGRSTPGALEATAEPGCLLAVATEPTELQITRSGIGGGVTKSTAPTLFCTCTTARISIASSVGSEGGVALLRADAAALGGSRAFAFTTFRPASALRTDEACSDASLDAWIDAKRYPRQAANGEWFSADPRRASLSKADLKIVGVAPPARPFVVADVPKDGCLVAISSSEHDALALRIKGVPPLGFEAAGAIARCAQAEATAVVSREGSGELAVLVAPAVSVGGSAGIRELVASAGVSLSSVAVPASDRAWDARALLLASAVPDAIISTAAAPTVPTDPEARVVALSFEKPHALTPDIGADVVSFCVPALDADPRNALCVFSGPQKWRTTGGDAVGGLARSKLPFWLLTMQDVSDSAALKGIAQLFGLARKLSQRGFAPTTLEALTELADGVEVLGRTGEDAVVAVGVAPAEPFVYTLTDQATWALDGAPRIVPLAPLTTVRLTSQARVLPPKALRRTVVFRRQSK